MIVSIINHLKQHSQWPAVEEIVGTLHRSGYVAYLAGGCVRDALLGRVANDLDVATDALPEVVEQLFPKTVAVGKSFGVIRVIVQNEDIEVATFRQDGDYLDGRRPQEVSFSSPQGDAERRDFTINALFFDPKNNEIIDFVGGQKDISAKLIRAVGDPLRRFHEDKLRILRALRFVSQLGFEIEAKTYAAILQEAGAINQVSFERIKDEIFKLLSGAYSQWALPLLKDSGVMNHILPEYRTSSYEKYLSPSLLPWQNFALFSADLMENELGQVMTRFRFANAEKKLVASAVKTLQKKILWADLRSGQCLQLLTDPGVFFAVSLMAAENLFYSSEVSAKVDTGLRKLLAWDYNLPSPMIRGTDLPESLRGPVVGEILQQVYWYQLENEIMDREHMLRYLEDILKEKNS